MHQTRRQFVQSVSAFGAATLGLTQLGFGAETTGKGRALAIGLNRVDPGGYGGWTGDLDACENDADFMKSVAESQSLETQILKTEQATRDAVLGELQDAARQLSAGDLYVVSFSGHGSRVPDINRDERENGSSDLEDETWCLFETQILDDELYQAWSRFKAGVRILVFIDSCHSGTSTKNFGDKLTKGELEPPKPKSRPLSDGDALRAELQKLNGERRSAKKLAMRSMPVRDAAKAYREKRADYDARQRALKSKESRAGLACTVISISGCRDDQQSFEFGEHGLFTGRFKEVWNNGAFDGSHQQLHQVIIQGMPSYQTPFYYVIGAPNATFEQQRPYDVKGAGTSPITAATSERRKDLDAIARDVEGLEKQFQE